jgi:hypothetical protein
MKIKAKDLKLADHINLGFSVWGSAIVQKVTENNVRLYRPYGVNSDFSVCGDTVICYVGIEEFEIWRDDREYEVERRVELR